MKLLTINTHSIVERNYKNKLNIFVDAIAKIKPDIIAMQEVNQVKLTSKYNHAKEVVTRLEKLGIKYYYKWLPIKLGYGMFDEGIAILSIWPIEKITDYFISDVKDYGNWKTRKVLGVKVKDMWFYSVHMGWWNDKDEPFINQWNKLTDNIDMNNKIWLLGDFNSEAGVIGEGYDLVCSSGFYDSYKLAKHKDDGITVGKKIDGWKHSDVEGMRIDYIFSNYKANVLSSTVVFNGENYDIVSDHYGVLIEVMED